MKKSFRKLGSVADIIGGYAFSSKEMQSQPSAYQLIKMSNLYQGTLDLTRSPSYWEQIDSKTQKYLLRTDDILITLTGTVGKRDFGFTVIIQNEKNLLLNQRVCCIRPVSSKVMPFYLFQYLKTKHFLDQFFDGAIGGTGNQTNVSLVDLKELDILLPPLPEQKAIADLLSTWDSAIEKTERLIAGKEKRFQWLLDELITKPSKSGKWRETRLGDLYDAEITIEKGRPLTRDEIGDLGTIPVVAGGQSYSCYHDYATHITETITISSSGAYAGFVWYHSYPIWASDCSVITSESINLRFLYHVLKSKQQIIYSYQSGGAQPHVYSKDIATMKIALPMIKKQVEIASILDDAGREVQLLKDIADKYKEQKRGLMQKLLTGEWRVKMEG